MPGQYHNETSLTENDPDSGQSRRRAGILTLLARATNLFLTT
jgi:hypothetical protein